MATTLNNHLRDGTDEIDVVSLYEISDDIREHFGHDETEWRTLGWEERSSKQVEYVEEVMEASFYEKPDHYGAEGRGFDYEEAIEKAQEEGNETVVVNCLS